LRRSLSEAGVRGAPAELVVASPDNPTVRRLRRAAARRAPGLALLEGPRVVREAVDAGVPLEVVALRERTNFAAAGVPSVVLSAPVFRSVAQTETPQGVLALARIRPVGLDAALGVARAAGWPLVVLDGVQDPGNVGTIARTAAAAGAPAVGAIRGSADPYSPKAVRASAGAIFRLTVGAGDWGELAGVAGVGAAADGGAPPERAGLAAAPMLVLGSEAQGLSRDDLPLVTIPLAPGVASLNVAAASAVLLFQIRQELQA
jgi:TrmH family RNA methyltransferase